MERTYALPDACRPPISLGGDNLGVDSARGDSSAGGVLSADEGDLLRDEEGRASKKLRSCAKAGKRLRASRAQAGAGKAMLRGLRFLPGHSRQDVCLRLSARGRGIFYSPFGPWPSPVAPSTCSTAARLISLRRRLAPHLRDERKETSTGGFYEILTDNPGGHRARHSERNFAFD